jgi:nucleoside 2-deoxyribosyltransferase
MTEDRTYIAGPFFNEEQQDLLYEIETLLDQRGDKYFTPREYGVIVDDPMTPERIGRIFDMNIFMLTQCNRLLAITDNFDPGTMFEIGYFSRSSSNIITYSSKGYGANVMIAEATKTHCQNMDELQHALNGHIINHMEVTE